MATVATRDVGETPALKNSCRNFRVPLVRSMNRADEPQTDEVEDEPQHVEVNE